jgi:hypothetical protein
MTFGKREEMINKQGVFMADMPKILDCFLPRPKLDNR